MIRRILIIPEYNWKENPLITKSRNNSLLTFQMQIEINLIFIMMI